MAESNAASGSASGRTPVLFLSYSRVDSEEARELKRRLEESPAGRHAGLKVWFDKDDIAAGGYWQQSIEIAIAQQSTAFAVYVGSKGIVNWVRPEVRLAMSRATSSDSYPFIPIIAKDSDELDLPPFARQYHGVCDPLNDTAEMEKLLRAVLAPTPGGEPILIVEEPYVGLRAMEEADADRFFGREAELDDLVAKVRSRRLTALIADSGAGKSSLVRAGLIPAWRRRELAEPGQIDRATWHVVVMRPGASPQAELIKGVMTAAERLGRSEADRMHYLDQLNLVDPSSREHKKALERLSYALLCGCSIEATQTLLVVDQFEELFTQTPPDQRQAFVELLLYLTDEMRCPLPFRVVLTMRADYANVLHELPRLCLALQRGGNEKDKIPGEVRLKALTDGGLARIVHEPMRLAGHQHQFQRDRLCMAIRQDLERRPGDTALLAVALYRVWEKYEKKRNNSSSDDLIVIYQEIGRISGALGDTARETIEKLEPHEQGLLPGIWARLILPGEDQRKATRRIAQLQEFSAERQRLAQSLAGVSRKRLLLTTTTTAEIAHEALFAQWDVLREFVRADGELLRQLGRLRDATRQWSALPDSPQSPGRYSLFERIKAALGWLPPARDGREEALERGPDRIVFAALATAHSDWLTDDEHRFVVASDAAADRVRANSRWERKAWTVAASVAALAAFVMTVLLFGTIWFWVQANAQRQVADSQRATADQQRQVASTNESRALLAERLAKDERDAAQKNLAAATANKSRALTALSDTALANGDSLNALKLAIAAWPRTDKDLARPMLPATLDALAAAIVAPRLLSTVHNVAAVSRDGTRAVFFSPDGSLRLWDVMNAKQIGSAMRHNRAQHVHFFADDTLMVTATWDGALRIWDAKIGAPLGEEFRPHAAANIVSNYGSVLAMRSAGTYEHLWHLGRGTWVFESVYAHVEDLRSGELSADGMRFATVSRKGVVQLWDAVTDLPVGGGPLEHSNVTGAGFSIDGKYLTTWSYADSTVRLWNAASGVPVLDRAFNHSKVGAVALSKDATRLLTWSNEGTVRVWDTASGISITFEALEHAKVASAILSPDGTRLATISSDGPTQLFDTRDGAVVQTFRSHEVRGVAFSDDSKHFVTLSANDTVLVWDATSGITRVRAVL